MNWRKTHFVEQVSSIPFRQKSDYRNSINLSSNEFVYPELHQLVDDWIQNLTPELIARYPYYPETEAVVANYFDVEQQSLALFSGADEAIRVLLCALGNQKKLILSSPNYDAYQAYAPIASLVVNSVELRREQSLESHVAELRFELQSRSPCIFVITNPHPLTGEVYSNNVLKKLEGICNSSGHLMVVDEAYTGFDGNIRKISSGKKNCLSIRSFSKCFGMAGLRLAAVVGPPDVVQQLRLWRAVNSISGPSLSLLEHFIANDNSVISAVLRLTKTRRWFCDRLSEKGIHYWQSKTNFLLLDLQTTSKRNLALKNLRNNRIIVKAFPLQHPFSECLRVTLTDRKIMEIVLDCL